MALRIAEAMSEGARSVAMGIAALVGCRETGAFHRAFKKWNGVQPDEYRLQQTKPPRAADPRGALR